MILVILVVLAAGVLPARMSVASLAIFWAPWTLLALLSASALCRGHLKMGESSHYTLVTAAVYTRALRCAIFPSRTKFKVTPKQGADAGGLRSLGRVRLVVLSRLWPRGGPGLARPRDPRIRPSPPPTGLGRHLRHGTRDMGALPCHPFARDGGSQAPAARTGALCLRSPSHGHLRAAQCLLWARRRRLAVRCRHRDGRSD